MKKFLIASLILLSGSTSYAIGQYEVGDTLFVWGYNGLVFRAEPSIKGARVAVLPYGTQVIVAGKDSTLTHTVKEFGGFVMRGIWARVRYQDTLQGYVFDGYLSTFPAREQQVRNDWFKESIPYLETIFGQSKRTRADHQPNNSHCLWKKDIYTFRNGAIAVQECVEGGSIQKLEIPNFSFEEAYLLIFLNPKLHWQKRMKKGLDDIELEITQQNRKSIRMHYEMTDYIFEKKAGKVFIKFWSSC